MRSFFLIFILITSNVVCAEEPIYSFGVVPQQAASKLARVWSPILQYLEREHGISQPSNSDYPPVTTTLPI